MQYLGAAFETESFHCVAHCKTTLSAELTSASSHLQEFSQLLKPLYISIQNICR